MASMARLGQQGEDVAVNFLIAQGYEIIDRNFRIARGEIDVIAWHRGVLCFVEVKARMSDACGDPAEAVTRRKQRTIARIAEYYQEEYGWAGCDLRFDVVAVVFSHGGQPELQLFQDAFMIDG